MCTDKTYINKQDLIDLFKDMPKEVPACTRTYHVSQSLPLTKVVPPNQEQEYYTSWRYGYAGNGHTGISLENHYGFLVVARGHLVGIADDLWVFMLTPTLVSTTGLETVRELCLIALRQNEDCDYDLNNEISHTDLAMKDQDLVFKNFVK